jgi:hypothetical protein
MARYSARGLGALHEIDKGRRPANEKKSPIHSFFSCQRRITQGNQL